MSERAHAESPRRHTAWILAGIVLVGLGLRVGAAIELTGRLGPSELERPKFLFWDSESYWHLARTIVEGQPYQIFDRPPRKAFRTPGYPAFLALGMWIGGESARAVRLVQAFFTALLPLLVFVLARRYVGPRPALAAAAFSAVYPYFVYTGVILLSDSIFAVLLLGVMLGLAGLGARPRPTVAIMTGLLTGLTVLVRPSFLLFIPFWAAGSFVFGRCRRSVLLNGAVAVAAMAAAMSPWVVRNWQATGRFIPTATTFGVTLYDGLSPTATGASDQRFSERPEWQGMDPIQRDRRWARMAVDWARHNPGRTLELAGIKFLRFWSPWPNAPQLSAWWMKAASVAVVVPLFVLIVVGLCRWPSAGWRSALFLLGPLIYFTLVHMIVVSSIRYRVPAMPPAMVLAALGSCWLVGRRAASGPLTDSSDPPPGTDEN